MANIRDVSSICQGIHNFDLSNIVSLMSRYVVPADRKCLCHNHMSISNRKYRNRYSRTCEPVVHGQGIAWVITCRPSQLDAPCFNNRRLCVAIFAPDIMKAMVQSMASPAVQSVKGVETRGERSNGSWHSLSGPYGSVVTLSLPLHVSF